MALQADDRLGAYEIRGSLGAGGMGEVYRARDTKLDRDVALKILPPDMVADAARLERFSREARALAALNHPNIVTIYSTEEADGIRFLTMELVEGKSLDRLVPETGLPLPQLLDIAVPLCDAIAAAHDKHLTHRDLKPANVMVSDAGRVKVLDFGLASFGRPEPHQPDVTRMELTHQGTVLGTAPYMSPEQVEGKTLDQRTDIFSLGIMLYEMATGRRPFQGDSSPALMSSILKDTPASVRDLRSDLPNEFVRLVARCLEKDPRDRVQTARDVFNEVRLLRRELSSGTGSHSRTAPAPPRSRYPLVAVALFDARAAGNDAQVLAEGLVEDIAAALSRFSYIRVGARSDARYVIEGTVRKAGANLRITARLVDTVSGVHLWAETFNRTADSDAFALQDQLTNRIVATVADQNGVLVRSMAAGLSDRPYDQLGAIELVLRYFVYTETFRPEEHARLRDALEAAVAREPNHGDALAALSRLYENEHSHQLNPRPDSLVRAKRVAERAVEISPMGQQGWEALASVHFFSRDLASLRVAVDRVVALNPLNASSLAYMAMLTAWSGNWEHGLELLGQSMERNPNHAGWHHFVTFTNFYRLGRFEESLNEAKRINMPQLPWTHTSIAVAAGQLGRRSDAETALVALRRINPHLIELDVVREAWSRWFWDEPLVASMIDGMHKAMALALVGSTPSAVKSVTRSAASDTVRARIAAGVAPFTVQTTDSDVRALAEGLVEDIASGLGRFSYLVLVSDAAAARFVVGGSVRKAGNVLRVSAHLLDRNTGAQLWAETYQRNVSEADLFALQDDLRTRIVATVADSSGVLVRSMAAALDDRPYDQFSGSELLLKKLGFSEQGKQEEHGQLRDAFEEILKREPKNADAWAALASFILVEHANDLNARPQSLERAQAAAERAIAINALCQNAWCVLAGVHFFNRDRDAMRVAAERAVTLNPLDGTAVTMVAAYLLWSGDRERAIELVRGAIDANPHHPGWFHIPPAVDCIRRGDYEAALAEAKRINSPHRHFGHTTVAIAAGWLGRRAEARSAVNALRVLDPECASVEWVRATYARWAWDEDMLELFVDGFRKALQLAGSAGSESPLRSPRSTVVAPASTKIATAVTPFVVQGSGAAATAIAEGLSEEVTAGLAKFDYLSVISDPSTARYHITGTVRQLADAVRVNAALTDTESGARLWSETYNHNLTSHDTFSLVDELTDCIVATVADAHGALLRSMAHTIRERALEDLSARELTMAFWAYDRQQTSETHARLRPAVERAVERWPNDAGLWAVLAHLQAHRNAFAFDPHPDAIALCLQAARRGIDLDPTSQNAWQAIAVAHFFGRDRDAFLDAVERAIRLNPRNANTMAWLASLIGHSGEDDERAAQLATRAMTINPNHPGWYYFPIFERHYFKGEFAAALQAAKKINMPDHIWWWAALAMGYARTGLMNDAASAIRKLRDVAPAMKRPEAMRQLMATWQWSQVRLDDLMDAFNAAEAATEADTKTSAPKSSPAATSLMSGRFSIAVRLFNARTADADCQTLAEGLTDDVTVGLSRFQWLSVVSANASYVIEGSLRKAGTTIRVSVQLIDSEGGGQLWAENYDRDLAPGAFVVQDDLASRIVATVADANGVLLRTMADAVAGKALADLTVNELFARFMSYTQRFRRDEHAELREAFERAVEREPGNALGWGILAVLYAHEVTLHANPLPNTAARTRAAAERAMDLAPTSQASWIAAAQAAYLSRDRAALHAACERAVTINPLNARSVATTAVLLAFSGDYARASDLLARAERLNPNHPGWYRLVAAVCAVAEGNHEGALQAVKATNMPAFTFTHLLAVAAAGHLGRPDEARTALDGLTRTCPELRSAERARAEWTLVHWDEALIDRLVAGFERALKISESSRD